MAQAHSAPLTGYRIAVTSARRAEELCALLRRQGAEVCSAPAIKMIALPDDDELQNNTEALIADPPDILVAHTGIGFRGWLAAAEGWGLANELLESLSSARIISRGPKATGALRAAGLREEWSPNSESSHEVLEYLLESGCPVRVLPSSCTVPPTAGTRFRNFWAGYVSPARKWCRSGFTGGSRRH